MNIVVVLVFVEKYDLFVLILLLGFYWFVLKLCNFGMWNVGILK